MSHASLTEEQQTALDLLMKEVQAQRTQPVSDGLYRWFGVSREDVASAVNQLLSKKEALEQRLLDWVEHRPLDSTFQFLAAASLAFYAAERHANPKIETYVDAFYYISTCASVGYADIFAVTQQGRAIASLVMMVGPAMTGQLLQRPKEAAVVPTVIQN